MARWENSKSQPWRYSWMLDDIAEMEKTDNYKMVTHKNISIARNYLPKYKRVKYLDMIFTIDGKQIMANKFDMIDGFPTLVFENFNLPITEYSGTIQTKVPKSLKDYNTKPNRVGDYKNCEGGGWYSMANLYELNGKFYTDAY
jgi:hypothetical protein